MFQSFKSNGFVMGVTALATAFAASNASAAVDVTDAVAEITGSHAAIGLLGGAALITVVIIKTYKRLQRAA